MPRLIVRAGETAPVNGALARALGGERVGQRTLATVGGLLEEQTRLSGAQLVTVPSAHGGMMVTQAGAAATAEAMKQFLDDLDRGEPGVSGSAVLGDGPVEQCAELAVALLVELGERDEAQSGRVHAVS